MNCSMPGFPVHHQLPELAQTIVHWVGHAIQPSHPLKSLSPPAFNLSQHQGLFQWVCSLYQVAKYWSFSFGPSPSSEYSRLITFRIDWFDLLAIQGPLKNLLQHQNSKSSPGELHLVFQLFSLPCLTLAYSHPSSAPLLEKVLTFIEHSLYARHCYKHITWTTI